MPFTLSVEGGEDTDDSLLRNVLDTVGVIASDEILVLAYTDDSVESICSAPALIKSDVEAAKLPLRLLDYHHIPARPEERTHARPNSGGCIGAVFLELTLYEVRLSCIKHQEYLL